MKNLLKKDSKIEFIEPDYEGISKVLAQFVELYKVCENKELLDKCLESFVSPQMIKNVPLNGE
jgi:hypothetical protein